MKPLLSILLILTALLSSANALQFRDNQNTSDNARFIGPLSSPSTLSTNPSFLLNGFETTGIAWFVQDNRRQFAMVSPQHFVCATHFRPSANGQVRFLGSDGQIYTHEIRSVEIISDANGNTDLTLGTLEEAVDTSVITPFRYANFNQQSSYFGAGHVFGITATAGFTSFTSISRLSDLNLSVSASFDNTQFLLLQYNIPAGNPNDSFLESGDSGSPSFLSVNGELALVGTNSLVADTENSQFAFAAFIPFYANELNALMANEGFQLSPLNPSVTTLDLEENVTLTLRKAYPGSIALDVTNTGSTRANNIEIRLEQFSTLPDSITGADFFERSEGTNTIILNRAFLDPGESGQISLLWNALPATANLSFNATVKANETNETSLQISESLLPSFRQFVSGFASQGEEGDDDGDTLGNLLEYALGGDLNTSSPTTPTGLQIGITVTGNASGDGAEVTFLQRNDAAQRGLTYTLLAGTNFPLENPIDLSSATIASSSEPGFEQITLTLNDLIPGEIFTLQIALDEDPGAP